ncbi:glycoside hydrolase family 28 protein [Membranicola marinus]|uniref:Glycoside hydrolase family 28 protein n=2 Tax=Membranihabitans marinus TaxID=1227546 RepID=A0A953HW14_9BACT|nr:glycosyl hydrolase family 28 protein [Membranihabitans marinus]MBY5959525.1 glycoside hydrolase family 28 protein [Membranihabitans marinus]
MIKLNCETRTMNKIQPTEYNRKRNRTIKSLFTLCLMMLLMFPLTGQNYYASLFGIKSDGKTLNTTSIQKAIDYIHEQGGGTLEFYVGRYLTGTIELKSNVTLHLHEGAVLLGSTNIYDYNIESKYTALVYAKNASNITIQGKGVIDGQGREVAYHLIDQIHKGIIKDQLKYDRPARRRPSAIYFRECDDVAVKGILVKNAAFWVQIYDQCDGLLVDSTMVDSKAFWNNDGMDIVDCKNVRITNNYVDASDDAICFKSHGPDHIGENVLVRNNVVRSSANGIKFGTVTRGGYRNFNIVNNTVYDTYRSAIAFTAPDGGFIEDIWVDSLYAYNTGNPIYLRNGERWGDKGPGSIDNITIQNVYAEVAAEKPDTAYEYEGPIEDLPRNISPSGIVGLVGTPITNVSLKNIKIIYPGGSNPNYAFRGTEPEDLDSIPEMADAYPEFSQFKELPAWGFYIRHAEDVSFENVELIAKEADYRPAMVVQDSKNISLKKVDFKEPGKKKKELHTYQSENVKRRP